MTRRWYLPGTIALLAIAGYSIYVICSRAAINAQTLARSLPRTGGKTEYYQRREWPGPCVLSSVQWSVHTSVLGSLNVSLRPLLSLKQDWRARGLWSVRLAELSHNPKAPRSLGRTS